MAKQSSQRKALSPEQEVISDALRAHWDHAKALLGRSKITQKLVAEFLEIEQPSVCQYLTKVIPVNTDIVLKFVQFFKAAGYDISPKDIDPSLGALIEYQPKIFVLATIDRKPPSIQYIHAKKLDSSINNYGVQIDDSTVAVISPSDKVAKRSKVCVSIKSKHIIGNLENIDDENTYIRTDAGVVDIASSKILTMHKVVEIVKV